MIIQQPGGIDKHFLCFSDGFRKKSRSESGLCPGDELRAGGRNQRLRRENDESRSYCAENAPVFKDYGRKGANNEELFAPGRVGRSFERSEIPFETYNIVSLAIFSNHGV